MGTVEHSANRHDSSPPPRSIKDSNVVHFINDLFDVDDGPPTVIVLDNTGIHYGIDEATWDRWIIDHKAVLFRLPAYSPGTKKIEIVWRQLKFRWRRLLTWTKETIDADLAKLPARHGTKFKTRLS
ncbi:transposase [Burkholderia seminalis]|uniref:transposase n=1 Tax=Burkholderia seminalis TaxID=488731 RepID=UPI001CF49666|nr:transposase [Burkholderia seminalis]MCA7955724.1 transposase [Burkholderia seminalis]